jgi:hypothetical protein
LKNRNKKEALKLIQARLEEGKPKKEILEELSNIYNDRSAITELIAMTPDRKTKEKYKLLNYIVICCLILSLIALLYAGLILSDEKPVEIIIESLIVLSIFVAFILEVLKFKGYIYNLLTFLALLGLIADLVKISEFGISDIIWIILVLAFAGLTFYLSKKMFPNYGFFGLKKNKNGDYLLE